ncbi:efflux RND transporter periplasmic adaptor subunit [Streptococcus pneumoniae]
MVRNKRLMRRILLAGTAVILAGGGAAYLWLPSPDTEIIENRIQTLSVKDAIDKSRKSLLTLSGEVAANNSSKVKIDTSKGEVKEVFVKNGDTVEVGQALFSYATSQAITAQSAQYDVASKQASVSAAENTLALKWESYNRKLARLNELRAKSGEEAEGLADQIKSAEDEVGQALTDARTAENEVRLAQIEAEKAENLAQAEEERTKYDTVTADTAGVIQSMKEDLPNQSKAKKDEETFFEIIDQSKILVKGSVSEFDRDKVQVGQKVEVVDRKDSKKRWTGTITQIGNLAQEATNGKQEENPNQGKFPYQVELDANNEPPLIGSHAYLHILGAGQEPGKLTLKSNYLFKKDGKTYVWKVEDKKIKQQEVGVKEISKNLYEVVSGLVLDDSLAIPKDGMKDGMEVGARVTP